MGNTFSFTIASVDKATDLISTEGLLELKANLDNIRGQNQGLAIASNWLSGISKKTNRCVCLAGPHGTGQSRFIKLVAKALYGPDPTICSIDLADVAEIENDEDVAAKLYEYKAANVIVLANVTQHHSLLLKTVTQVIRSKVLTYGNDKADFDKTLFVISFHVKRDTNNADSIIHHTKQELYKINSTLSGLMDEIIPFMSLSQPTVKAIIKNELLSMGRLELIPKVDDICSSVFHGVRGFRKSVRKYVQELDGRANNGEDDKTQEKFKHEKRPLDNNESAEAKRIKFSPKNENVAASELAMNNSTSNGNKNNTNTTSNNNNNTHSAHIPQPQADPQQEEIRRLKEQLEKKEKEMKEAKKAEYFKEFLQDIKNIILQISPKPLKVFFSYTWPTDKDETAKIQAIITRLGDLLTLAGIDYYFDLNNMQGNIYTFMKESMENSDRCILICTPSSKARILGTINSLNNMQREAFLALALMMSKRNFVIPLIAEGDRDSSVSPHLQDILSLDLTDGSKYETTIASPAPLGIIPMIINLPDQPLAIRSMYSSFWNSYQAKVKLLDLSQ